jgi:D-alanine-D-alanine ligase
MSGRQKNFRRVAVVTGDHQQPDATKPDGRYSADDLRYHNTMCAALDSLDGYDFEFISDHSNLIERLRDDPPDFVLNFCDTGFRNVAVHELHLPALLELYGIPYSGAPPACIAICYDKAIVRQVADSLAVPAPREMYLAPDQGWDRLDEFSFPAFIKPNRADGSVGITRDAVVRNPREARAHIAELRRQLPGHALLLQEYLPGAEYGLTLIGNPGTGYRVLPPLTVDYSGLPEGLSPILAYEAKNQRDSPYWTQIHYRPAELDGDRLMGMVDSAERLFARLHCRDYARFDFRTGVDGAIKLMEVNPNPAWDHEAKMALMAGYAGKSYAELLGMILAAAQARLTRGG